MGQWVVADQATLGSAYGKPGDDMAITALLGPFVVQVSTTTATVGQWVVADQATLGSAYGKQ